MFDLFHCKLLPHVFSFPVTITVAGIDWPKQCGDDSASRLFYKRSCQRHYRHDCEKLGLVCQWQDRSFASQYVPASAQINMNSDNMRLRRPCKNECQFVSKLGPARMNHSSCPHKRSCVDAASVLLLVVRNLLRLSRTQLSYQCNWISVLKRRPSTFTVGIMAAVDSFYLDSMNRCTVTCVCPQIQYTMR